MAKPWQACSVWKRIKFPTFWYNYYYFTWSDTYFIQLETLLINHPSYHNFKDDSDNIVSWSTLLQLWVVTNFRDDDDDTCYWGETLQIYQKHSARAKSILNGTLVLSRKGTDISTWPAPLTPDKKCFADTCERVHLNCYLKRETVFENMNWMKGVWGFKDSWIHGV